MAKCLSQKIYEKIQPKALENVCGKHNDSAFALCSNVKGPFPEEKLKERVRWIYKSQYLKTWSIWQSKTFVSISKTFVSICGRKRYKSCIVCYSQFFNGVIRSKYYHSNIGNTIIRYSFSFYSGKSQTK